MKRNPKKTKAKNRTVGRWLLAPPSSDDVIMLFRAWRFWLLGALVGAFVGAGIYYAFPPPYRARATVNVDFQLEKAWPQNSDREQFYYLERETRKLIEVAMSDATLGAVATEIPGVTIQQMREGKLQLSQPGIGGWHFYADDMDPDKAISLASTWASAFTSQVQKQVLESSGEGLEPYITASIVQVGYLATSATRGLAAYLLGGAVLVLAIGAIFILFLDLRL